jgi:type IV pilus assembly protein PilC
MRFINLVEAGEAAGILEALLDRLRTWKTEAIKDQVCFDKNSIAVVVAFVVVVKS